MSTRGDKRAISQRAVQTFWVVLDVCCLVYAILDLPQCRPAKDAVVNLLKKFGGAISAGANRFMGAIRGLLPKLSDAQKSGGLLQAVKEVASAIGRAVADVFNAIMKNRGGLSALKSITLAVFQAAMSSWVKAVYYIGQFIAGAIALISAIGAMVKKIVALIAALAALIYDAIGLSQMGDQASPMLGKPIDQSGQQPA
jgi:phage-related protein